MLGDIGQMEFIWEKFGLYVLMDWNESVTEDEESRMILKCLVLETQYIVKWWVYVEPGWTWDALWGDVSCYFSYVLPGRENSSSMILLTFSLFTYSALGEEWFLWLENWEKTHGPSYSSIMKKSASG